MRPANTVSNEFPGAETLGEPSVAVSPGALTDRLTIPAKPLRFAIVMVDVDVWP